MVSEKCVNLGRVSMIVTAYSERLKCGSALSSFPGPRRASYSVLHNRKLGEGACRECG